MTISGIGGSMAPYMGRMPSMGQMSGADTRPDSSEPFNKADEDGSGALDQAEFSDMAQKLSQMTGEEMDAEEAFSTYDEDGDGVLSEDETISFMEDNRPDGPPPGGMGPMPGGGDPSQMFSNADEDEDGSLDETESESIVGMINNATDQEMTVEDLIAEYDENEDGVLSEEETLSALEDNRPDGPPPGGMGPIPGGGDPSQLFSDADEDEDGSLDETESESIVDMINNATNQEMAVEDLIAEYDENEDGVLSEEEAASALEDNRPESDSSSQASINEPGGVSFAHMAGVENYMRMASMAKGPEGSNEMFGMSGSGSLNSLDARI